MKWTVIFSSDIASAEHDWETCCRAMMQSSSDQLFREFCVLSVTEFVDIFSYRLLISDLFSSLSTERALEAHLSMFSL